MSDFFDPDEWETRRATSATQSSSASQTSEPTQPPTSAPTQVTVQSVVAAEVKQAFFELKPVGQAPKIAVEPLAVASSAVVSEVAPDHLPDLVTEVAPQAIIQAVPVRMPEPLDLPTDFPEFAAPEGMHVDLSDLGIGSDEPLTRRQIRERERLTGADIIEETPAAPMGYEARLPYDDDLLEQIPELATTQVEVIDEVESPSFAASPGMIIEPVTNSIVIDQVQDLSNYTSMVNSTGEILTTGSIQIPVMIPDTTTGEIKVIKEADALDAAIQADNGAGFISSVAPMRVTGIVGILARTKVIPTNLRKGKNQPYLVLATAVLIILAGAVVVAGFLLKPF